MAETTADGPHTGPGESASLESFGYKQELKRALSFWDLIVFGLIVISPTAPTAIFGVVYGLSHGMPPLAYAVGLVAMLFTALSYMVMSRAFPMAGSAYAFAGRGIGAAWGFIAGWMILLDYLLVPALCYAVAGVAVHAILPQAPAWALVLGFLAIVTVTNLIGIEAATWFNKAMLWLQLAVIAGFVVLGGIALSHGVSGAHFSFAPIWQPHTVTAPLIFGALSVAALSFLGFDAISTLSEETKGGPKAVGLATVLSLCIAATLFVIQTWLACLFVLGKPSFGAHEDTAFLEIANLVGGVWFERAASVIGIAMGSIACALVAQAACARLIYGMARDRKLPRLFAHVSGTRQTPERATFLIALISAPIGVYGAWPVITGGSHIGQLSSMVNVGALTGFMLVHLSVFIHFGIKSGRKILLHLVSPVLGFAIVAYILVSAERLAKIVGGTWLIIGLIVLIILVLKKKPLDAIPEG